MPSVCAAADVQSHHGSDTDTVSSWRALRSASVRARSKKYR
jgi:hypothetical protein